MDTGILLRAARVLLSLLCVVNLALLALPGKVRGEAVADMRKYCSVPPQPGFSVRPNLLLLIDNSASMYDPAYTKPDDYCVDDGTETYLKSTDPFLGYFDPATVYGYTSSVDANGNETGFFAPIGSSIPKSSKCNAVSATDQEYVCINTTKDGKVDNFLAKGSFLNWLTMSKLDIEKKVLTGGKVDASGMLQAETRGCQGKRFIKMLGDSDITFAVRGPVPAESDYVYRASQGGSTRIEIYTRRYRKDACLKAVEAWKAQNLETLKEQATICRGDAYEADGETPTKGKIYTTIMTGCYGHLAGVATALDLMLNGEVNQAGENVPGLLDDCIVRIQNRYNDDTALIKKNEGDQVCGANIYHRVIEHFGQPISYGYMGACYMPGGMGFDEWCARWMAEDVCYEMQNPSLTDPSATANFGGTGANLPAFILEAGVYSLGEVAGTLLVRTTAATAPTGLVQEYKDQINLGAMVFNSDGAGSECGAASGIACLKHCKDSDQQCYQNSDCSNKLCVADAKRDGGLVISNLNDPGDLVTAINEVRADAWTPLAEAFYVAMGYFGNRSSFRLQETDFDPAISPSKAPCQKNNMLIITDGISTADRASAVSEFVSQAVSSWTNSTHEMPVSLTTSGSDASPSFGGSYNLDDLAWIARKKNLANQAQPALNERDYLTTHVVYTGIPCGAATGVCLPDEREPERMMQLTAAKGGGSMLSASKPAELAAALTSLFQIVQAGANAGTDASILSTGQGNGALYLQEQFYRRKSFDGGATSASWIGEMQGLWYFIDPFIASSGAASAVREDTDGDKALDLKKDRVVKYVYQTDAKRTLAQLYLDGNGDGNLDALQPDGYPLTVEPDAVQSLWRAGRQLWAREPGTRTIYTQTDGKSLIGLASNGTSLPVLDISRPQNQKLLQAANEAEAQAIVSFVQGVDGAGTRQRGVNVAGQGPRVWKLGDIVSSTPVLQTAVPLGNYHLANGYGDFSYRKFLENDAYGGRGTVYVGANDGMLHAFRLGILKQRPTGTDTWVGTKKASLDGEGIGEELWGYVPNSALPYLRYLKEPFYSHLFYVDGSTTIADVSIGDPGSCGQNSYWNCLKDPVAGTNWRTVLIGGMGLGGASRRADDMCTEGSAGTCVKAPESGGGLSSYFALDVTGQSSGSATAPKFLWEFSHPKLGFATSGAAILKINAQSGNPAADDRDKNGRWFAVFASGATGPLDPDSCEFLGTSNQNLRLFVVDLYTSPPFVEGNNFWIIDTKVQNAFGGSMVRAGIDADKWKPGSIGFYEDEALYLGYSRKADNGTWTTGGVLRLLTGEKLDPREWDVSTVIDGIGPVTGSVAKLQDRGKHNLWLYFGTGRFFHSQDDLAAERALFGVKEPCYTAADSLDQTSTCTERSPLLLSDLQDMTADSQEAPPESSKGWWIGLDKEAGSHGSERFTANPASLASGAVFFTTFKPANDACSQAVSYLWGVKYDTGGTAPASLQGKALVPLSSGDSSEFMISGLSERSGRRSPPMPGKPGGVKLITNSGLKPLKKIIHIQER